MQTGLKILKLVGKAALVLAAAAFILHKKEWND